MSNVNYSLCVVVSLSAFFCSSVFADQIILKDGDRVTGSIIKKDGEKLTIKSKNFGEVTLKWADIETIRTDQPLNVELPGDRTVKANIETRNNQIQVEPPNAPPQTVPPTEIVALRDDAEQRTYERFLNPGFFDLWNITGGLNLAGAIGNAETSTITTPVNLLRESKTSRTSLYFNSIRSTATVDGISASTARAVRGGWAFSRNLTPKIFVNTFNDYEYDRFQSLDLRVVLGGGLGYQVWTTERGRLALVAGVAWNHETFSPTNNPEFTRNSAEGYWGNDFNYKLNSRTNLIQTFRMFNNLTNTGEYRINLDGRAQTRLTKWLTWDISLSDRYLSNPVPGRKNNDFLYTTGLGFSWSR